MLTEKEIERMILGAMTIRERMFGCRAEFPKKAAHAILERLQEGVVYDAVWDSAEDGSVIELYGLLEGHQYAQVTVRRVVDAKRGKAGPPG